MHSGFKGEPFPKDMTDTEEMCHWYLRRIAGAIDPNDRLSLGDVWSAYDEAFAHMENATETFIGAAKRAKHETARERLRLHAFTDEMLSAHGDDHRHFWGAYDPDTARWYVTDDCWAALNVSAKQRGLPQRVKSRDPFENLGEFFYITGVIGVSNPNEREDLIAGLAEAFTQLAWSEDWIGQRKMNHVVRRNRQRRDNTCATHDYCDANMLMMAAFHEFGYVPCEVESADVVSIWNAAWDMAKRAEFYYLCPHCSNPIDGRAVL